MSGASKKLMGTTAAGADFLAVEDVFSTWLYTGNGSTQTITNGIDLAGEGGLVWWRARDFASSHALVDTERGRASIIRTNSDGAATTDSGPSSDLVSFNSDGFTLGSPYQTSGNNTGASGVSWTFRKAPRFFDVVTYTGDGTGGREIAHNLGVTPGFIVVKKTNNIQEWFCYHRSIDGQFILLNSTNAASSQNPQFAFGNDTVTVTPTDAVVTVGSSDGVNASGESYVMYTFAHDPLGPSGDGSDGLIACGSYTGTGAAGNFVDLGWEPQWLLVKPASLVDNWWIVDTMRGLPTGGNDLILNPNASSAEINAIGIANVDARGFYPEYPNSSGQTYIYIAIRRGPMRVPTSGTEVFDTQLWTGATTDPAATRVLGGIPNYPTDLLIATERNSSFNHSFFYDRMRGLPFITSTSTAAEDSSYTVNFDYSSGFRLNGFALHYLNRTYAGWNFRRAPGFFDVVAYTGTGSLVSVPHNLGVTPELIIFKNRTQAFGWVVCGSALGGAESRDNYILLNSTDPKTEFDNYRDANDTETTFGVRQGNSLFDSSGNNYIAYLFATLPGISKIGTFTHTSGTQTDVDCGFTAGARFVLIKRTDGISNWWVFDTARGIVVGNDPLLSLSDAHAEETIYDVVDPLAAGFSMDSGWGSGTYLFYAIA